MSINLGLDNGFGVDKYAIRDKNNNIVFGKVSSAIAEASADAEDMPLFEGKRYYLGDIALMEDSSNIKNIIDYKSHETYVPLSIWHVLDELKIKSTNINKLAVGLSLAQKDYAKDFIARITKFNVNNEKYDFKDRVVLVPQAIGAKYAIDHFYFTPETLISASYAIIDIGQLTVDNITVVNGGVRRENASGSEHDGIIKIIQELQEFIASPDQFGDVLSIKEVQEVLKSGFYTSYGEDHDLTEKIKLLKKSYTTFLMTKLSKTQSNVFKKYKQIFIVGGGAYYVDLNEASAITGAPLKSFIIPENPEFLNAIGNLLASEKN